MSSGTRRTESAAKDILAQLVSFDTTSHLTNLPMTDWIRAHLDGLGVESTVLPADDGIHANLFATLPASDGEREGGLCLSGHMDVVPAEGQPWTSDPFQMVERGTRLYGRGTADMKGFLACVLAAVPTLLTRKLKRPIHLAFSYDEEVGCIGVVPMIAEFGRTLPKPDVVFVGEPSRMAIVDGHKGTSRCETRVSGKAAHSSRPDLGVSAIFVAADLIGHLRHIETSLSRSHPAPRYDIPYTTISVGGIEGGVAHNIVPPSCTFRWGARMTPGVTIEAIVTDLQTYAEQHLLPRMRQVDPSCSIETVIHGSVPTFEAPADAAATSLALNLMHQNETRTVPYATEASRFVAAGCSSVIVGPGDIAQAHQADEFIEIAELDRCMAFLGRVGDWAAAG